MKRSRLLVLAAIIVLVGAFFAFDLGRYFSLDALRSQQSALQAWYQANPVLVIAAYFLAYVAVTGQFFLSTPRSSLLAPRSLQPARSPS